MGNLVKILSIQKAGVLFETPKLKRLSVSLTTLKSEYQHEQLVIISRALRTALGFHEELQEASATTAALDSMLSLAHVAGIYDWCKPILREKGEGDDHAEFCIKDIKHPMLEHSIGEACVANDFDSSSGRVTIITGPNMGGKSTFMRAVGLCTILAHIGSYIPAKTAIIPITDKILTRVGASDSLVRGASTLMVELQQVAKILERATERSLVIIDELGRGTSTHDGFGIAWATIQRLLTKKCIVLFATHFHELTTIETSERGVQNMSVNAHVQPAAESITMLYSMSNGACDKSYGIEVAKVARFPREIIEEASMLSDEMETKSLKMRQ